MPAEGFIDALIGVLVATATALLLVRVLVVVIVVRGGGLLGSAAAVAATGAGGGEYAFGETERGRVDGSGGGVGCAAWIGRVGP